MVNMCCADVRASDAVECDGTLAVGNFVREYAIRAPKRERVTASQPCAPPSQPAELRLTIFETHLTGHIAVVGTQVLSRHWCIWSQSNLV